MLAFMIYLHFLKILIQFLSDLTHSKGLDGRHVRDTGYVDGKLYTAWPVQTFHADSSLWGVSM